MADRADRPLGVHSLNSFMMAVPDLDEAQRFYTSFGLDVEHVGKSLYLRTVGSSHIWATVLAGRRKKLLAMRFGIYAQDVEAFTERLADVRIAAPDHGDPGSIWVQTPDGLTLEIAIGPKTAPDSKASFALPQRFSQARGAGPRNSLAPVRPRQMAHLALFTASVPDAIAFYTKYLGLALSDRSGDDVAFLHGRHGSDHHMIAVARSDGPGLHHASWDVGSLSDIGQGAMQMQAAGYSEGWGVGRHVLGSNYFYYARDPWGSFAEYSADMDYIAADTKWITSDSPPEDSFYQWGPPPPADFGTNYETA